jgi:SSS family solute:Na+ symporter
MTNVLDLMLYSYAFMVSGLFIPVLIGLYGKRPNATAAISAMIIGGATTVGLTVSELKMPYELDPNIFGITASALVYFIISLTFNKLIKR